MQPHKYTGPGEFKFAMLTAAIMICSARILCTTQQHGADPLIKQTNAFGECIFIPVVDAISTQVYLYLNWYGIKS